MQFPFLTRYFFSLHNQDEVFYHPIDKQKYVVTSPEASVQIKKIISMIGMVFVMDVVASIIMSTIIMTVPAFSKDMGLMFFTYCFVFGGFLVFLNLSLKRLKAITQNLPPL